MRWGVVLAAVGALSAAVGLYQAFSFKQLPVVSCQYTSPTQPSNLATCVDDLVSHVGDTVMLDFALYVADPPNDYSQPFGMQIYDGPEFNDTEFDDMVVWTFGAFEFGLETTGSPTSSASPNAIEERFPGYQQLGGLMEAFPTGVVVEVRKEIQRANPFSRVELQRDLPPMALEGPFQISTRQVDMALVLTLSPAPMTDDLAQQVRCAQTDWPDWLKFLGCPFV